MTDYLNGFHYENEKLKFFATAEGYVNSNLSNGAQLRQAFSYVYNYTDHLGNIRLSYTKGTGENPPVILEENHYYPFGLKHKKYGSVDKDWVCVDEDCYEVGIDVVPPQVRKPYQYKYNGKEYQDELNLNLYDFSARLYDPAIGRTPIQDPLAEMFYSQSSYSFLNNNPLSTIDPTGMAGEDWKKDDLGNYVYDANLTAQNASTQLGANETYLGESYTFNVNNSDGSQLGTVNLNADGTAGYTENGETIEFDNATVDLGFKSGNKIMAGNYQTGDVFDKGNWIIGAAASGASYTPGSFRLTNGAYNGSGWSPKYYPSGWTGGSVARISTYNIANIGRGLGKISFVGGIAIDAYGVMTGSTSLGKAGLNTTMGALGFTGWGTPAALTYGFMEAFHPQGAAGALRDYGQVQSDYRKQNNGAVFKAGL